MLTKFQKLPVSLLSVLYRNNKEIMMNILPDSCGPFSFHFSPFPSLLWGRVYFLLIF